MRRKPERSHILFPGLLLLALLLLFVPEAHVDAWRGRSISMLSPLLNMIGAAARKPEPRPALIKVERPETAEPFTPALPEKNNAEELDWLHAERARLIHENNRLRAALPQNESAIRLPPGIGADVIARRILWQEPILALNRGGEQGVRLHAGVLHRGAVVGRIISAGPRASTMALLTHRGMSIAARLLDCRIEGVLRGRGPAAEVREERLCTLSIVNRELHAKVGERVVTSGYDGAFPPGLLLGAVTAIKKTGDVQWEVSVRPACDDSAVECVSVITAPPAEVPWPAAPAGKERARKQ